MNRIHFFSGFSHSGSTLLAGILRQNVRYHTAMSSPVASFINGCLELVGAGGKFSTFFSKQKRKDICLSLFIAYYWDKSEYRKNFDTNRIWTARRHQLVDLFDDFKFIFCIRNPAWIMDNFDIIYRKTPFDYSQMSTPQSRQTAYSRCNALINAGGVVGSSWTALKEAYYGEYSDRLLLMDYDYLPPDLFQKYREMIFW